MQDTVMQDQAQPFVKLAQANMDLLTKFSTSSEVAAQASSQATRFVQQAGESTMQLMQSASFSHLIQGLMKNYTEFLTDFNQSAMAMISQGQATMTRQVQEVANEVTEATDSRARRARQAA